MNARFIRNLALLLLLWAVGAPGLQAQSSDYRQGVLYLAEGNFTDAPGEMHFVASNGAVTADVLAKVNGASPLGTTAQYAVQQGNHWYVTSKDYRQVNSGSQLVKLNAQTLVKEAALPKVFNHLPPQAWMAGEQVYHFLPLDDSTGWLTTTYGIYEVNLRSLSVAVDASSCAIPLQIDGFPSPARVDKLIRWGNYIVAAVNVQAPDGQDWSSSAEMGLYLIDRQQKRVVKKILGRYIMPVVTLEGQLWCAKETAYLTEIVHSGDSLREGQHVKVMHVPTYVSWGWNEGWLTASTWEDVLYMVDFNSWSANTILRIDLSAAQPKANPIWTGNSIYGNCREDPRTGNIWFSTFSGGYGVGEMAHEIAPGQQGDLHSYPFGVRYSFPSLPLFPSRSAATRGTYRLAELQEKKQYRVSITQPEHGKIVIGKFRDPKNYQDGDMVDEGTWLRTKVKGDTEEFLAASFTAHMGGEEIDLLSGSHGSKSFQMTADVAFSAVMAKGYKVTAEKVPGHQGDLGFSILKANRRSYALPGERVCAIPVPKPGYRTKSVTWNNHEIGFNSPDDHRYIFRMPSEAVQLRAEFEKVLAITYTAPEHGTLTVSTPNSDLKSGALVAEGTVLTVKTEPQPGYRLKALTANGEDISTTGQYTVKDKDVKIVCEFEIDPAQIFAVTFTAPKPEEGSLTVSTPNGDLKSGDKVTASTVLTVKAQAQPGYRLKALTANGEDISATGQYTVKDKDVKIVCGFESLPRLILTQPEHGTLTATCDGKPLQTGDFLKVGQKILFTAKAEEGYVVKGLVINEQLYATPCAFTCTSHNVVATALIAPRANKPTPVEPAVLADLRVYPNPATATLTLEGLAEARALSLVASTGQVVRHCRLQGESILVLDVSVLPSGLYLLVVEAGDGIRTLRVVKQ